MFDDKTIDEIAQAWVRAKREDRAAGKVIDAAAPYLRAWFDANPEERTYKGLIGLTHGSRIILDQKRLKAELGERILSFEQTIRFQALSLLVP